MGRRQRGGPMVWQVGLYIRLSREDGRVESLSVTNQRKILLDYLNHEFSGTWQLQSEYVDDGTSGTGDDRAGFQRMIADIRAGRLNCVLCKTLSRAFRNYADQGYFLEELFPRYRVRFISLGSPRVDSFLDPEAVEQGLEIPISGILNDRYAAKTSADVRRTFDMKRRRGEFIGSFAPYGYAKHPEDHNRLIPDPAAAAVVREIFARFLAGESRNAIARDLNEAKIPNPTAYKTRTGSRYRHSEPSNDGLWSGTTVGRILQNQVYAGDMVQGRQRVVSYKVHATLSQPPEDWYVVENTHEPLVSREDFLKVRERTAFGVRCPAGRSEPHPLSGLLICQDCGRPMTRRTAKGVVYYLCSTYRRKSKLKCTKHTIREDRVLPLLAEKLEEPMENLSRSLLLNRVQGIQVAEGGEVTVTLRAAGGAEKRLPPVPQDPPAPWG